MTLLIDFWLLNMILLEFWQKIQDGGDIWVIFFKKIKGCRKIQNGDQK
jgi:hypothetical protein